MIGVETTYAGTIFRSRLEARWAAFADLADWPWVYEPFDGNGYLPDFSFTVVGSPLLVEVKPIATPDEAREYLPKILTGIGELWKHDVLVAGIDPLRCLYIDFLHDETDWNTSPAEFSQCGRCGNEIRIHPANMGFSCATHNSDKWDSGPVEDSYINHLWREAGNKTRWSPTA